MKKLVIILSFLIISTDLYSQESFNFDLFNVSLNGQLLQVKGNSGENLYSYKFHNPSISEYDLDEDGVNELLVLDSTGVNRKPFYTLYLYNTIDSFYLIDSILSGSTEPTEQQSDETGGIIIVSGNADFEKFNTDPNPDFLFLPVNCWKYDGDNLFQVNDEVYNIYESQIDDITETIDEAFEDGKKDCETSKKLKSAIAAVFSDCINAGDKSIASHFVKNYYFCDDIEQFLQELITLTKAEENASE